MRKPRVVAAERSRTPPETNLEAIRLIERWAAGPRLHGKRFWNEFEAELRRERMTLRKPT